MNRRRKSLNGKIKDTMEGTEASLATIEAFGRIREQNFLEPALEFFSL
jgi:hypothetical protein